MTASSDIALVGCGAISEEFYLPAFARRRDGLARLWLVDPEPRRREAMATQFGIPRERAVAGLDDLSDDVTVAFNATPSHLHLPTTLGMLKRGINVFLEKPLGETGAEAEQIVASGGDLLIGVNQYRRLMPSFSAVKQRLEHGDLGRIRRIVWNEGNKFGWPAQSPFYFRRPWADGRPRGTLLDTGAHIIDLLCWWLGGELDVVDAQSDGYGGPEEFVFAHLARDGVTIELTISMHARMANRFLIEGDNGSIGGSVMDFRRIFLTAAGAPPRSTALRGSIDRADIADQLIDNFMAASAGEQPLLIAAASVLPSLKTIDAIYRRMRSPLPGYYREWQA